MKKLNSTNYVVKRSSRVKDFVVHGDRMKLYHGQVDSAAWPADGKTGQQAAAASVGNLSSDDPDSPVHVDGTHPTDQQPPAQLDTATAGNRRRRGGRGRSGVDSGQSSRQTWAGTSGTFRSWGNRHKL